MSSTTPQRTETEVRIHTALHTRTYGYGDRMSVSLPRTDSLRYRFEFGMKDGEFRRFCDDWNDVLLWHMRVLNYLTEQRIDIPQRRRHVVESWEDVQRVARDLFREKWDADLAEKQDEYDHDPDNFARYYRDVPVVDGKVTDPWGTGISGPARWWLENATLVAVWLVYQRVRDEVTDAVDENLGTWTDGGTDRDPRKVANETFELSMRQLDRMLTEQMKEEGKA